MNVEKQDIYDSPHDEELRGGPENDPSMTDENTSSSAPVGYRFVKNEDFFKAPPGLKLIPEDYIGVEPTLYNVMIQAMQNQGKPGQASPIQINMPKDEPEPAKPVFEILMLQQMNFGDIGVNLRRGEELEYCPEGRHLMIGGDKYTTLRSFLQIWNEQFGPRPNINTVRHPVFKILNPETCPPVASSYGPKPPQSRFRTDEERIMWEQRQADQAYDQNSSTRVQQQQNPTNQRVTQPSDPMEAMNQEIRSRAPMMPPRAGIIGPDGLTARGRAIKRMSADQVERAVNRRSAPQPIAGYEPPEYIEDFQVQSGQAGSRIVAEIPGKPADEAAELAAEHDYMAQRAQDQRTRY